MRERDPQLAVIDREAITRAARVLLGQIVEHRHVLVLVADVEPEVEGERIGAVVVADVAAEKAAIRLVEPQRLSAHAVAQQRRLDHGRRDAGRR